MEGQAKGPDIYPLSVERVETQAPASAGEAGNLSHPMMPSALSNRQQLSCWGKRRKPTCKLVLQNSYHYTPRQKNLRFVRLMLARMQNKNSPGKSKN